MRLGRKPAVLLLAARMSGTLYPAARKRVETRGIDINQARLAYHEGANLPARGRLFEDDDHISLFVSGLDVPVSLGDLLQ